MGHKFYACVDGTAEEYFCKSGLWFDEDSAACNWPESTDRRDCKYDAPGNAQILFFEYGFTMIIIIIII